MSVIDIGRSSEVSATVPVGRRPLGVAAHPGGRHVYVANYRSDTLSVIDTATRTVAASVRVGRGPAGVAVDPTGARVYVTNYRENTVSVIDAASNTVQATVPASRLNATTPIVEAVVLGLTVGAVFLLVRREVDGLLDPAPDPQARARGVLAMAAVTGGEVRGQVLKPEQRSPSVIGKLGFDRQLANDLRVRVTGSVYSTSKSISRFQ